MWIERDKQIDREREKYIKRKRENLKNERETI